ncbi:DUF4007 family protein [Anaeromicrobium sediminis]|nr:DUF4007 family protein [Anaeromicrobium sediminis]
MNFGLHQTFCMRQDWIYQGLRNFKKNNKLFLENNTTIMDETGLGPNSVKSIKFWMESTGLMKEEKHRGVSYHKLTDFGDLIWSHDRLLDEYGTLWFMHYKLTENREFATTWYWFFNKYKKTIFSKDIFIKDLIRDLKLNESKYTLPLRTLEAEYYCLVKTYVSENNRISDNFYCSLSKLNLLSFIQGSRGRLKKESLKKEILHPLVFLAILIEKYIDGSECKYIRRIDLSNLSYNVKNIFNMDNQTINYYLEYLKESNYINIRQKESRKLIELSHNIDSMDILKKYYNQINL